MNEVTDDERGFWSVEGKDGDQTRRVSLYRREELPYAVAVFQAMGLEEVRACVEGGEPVAVEPPTELEIPEHFRLDVRVIPVDEDGQKLEGGYVIGGYFDPLDRLAAARLAKALGRSLHDAVLSGLDVHKRAQRGTQ